MDLELSGEQTDLRAVAVAALDRNAPLSLARSFAEGTGDAASLWQTLADLGWYGVGGADDDAFGIAGLCLLAEQAGRHAAPIALIDTVACARALAAAGDGDPNVVAAVARGERTCSLAVLEVGGGWEAAEMSTVAEAPGPGAMAGAGPTGFAVTGEKLGVHHAGRADLIAVLTPTGLFLVDPRGPGVMVSAAPALDPATAPADVTFRDAPALAWVGGEAVASALRVAAVATAAEGIGAAGAALDLAVAYARDRVQYGRPIGHFQSLQHLMAEAHVQRETAWSTILFAAATIDEDAERLDEMATIAKAFGARAARTVVEDALQVFGGIGFTWEHDHHLLHRRALECERRFGDARFHERRLADLLVTRTAMAGADRLLTY